MSVHRISNDSVGRSAMVFKDGGAKQTVTYTWFRGDHCNYGPTLPHLEDWRGYQDYFLSGFAPAAPVIDTNTKVTAFGSCFAVNISKWLAARNYKILNNDKSSNSYVVRMGEGLVTSHAIRQQFEWAFENRQPQIELWHGYDATAFGYDPKIREETLAIFNNTDVFILTLGLSEVWYDKPTGEVFWRAVPRDKYDPSRHAFRTVSPEENYENLRACVELIRKHRPNAKVLMTLSPIPLVATFRPVSCVSANSVSKASLRLALDRLMTEEAGKNFCFYWPSYEIVIDGFLRKWEGDRRHVKPQILDFIMTLFEKAWCKEEISEKDLAKALLQAKSVDGSFRGSLRQRLDDMTIDERRTYVATKLAKRPRLAKTIQAAYSL
jgi:hypothetical protein